MNDLILEKQDLRFLEWSRIRRSSGTAGSFLKAFTTERGKKRYYKLSNYDAFKGITGHECVNELIVDRLLSLLGIDHLHYQLIHAVVSIDGKEQDTFLCASDDFRKKTESKIALDAFYQMEQKQEERPLDFCVRMGWESYIKQMLLVDFLILNRDRHGANMEVLRDRKDKTIRLAPLFDHGLSLFFQCRSDEDLSIENVMEDKRVQCFVGGTSAFDNLKLLSGEMKSGINSLREENRCFLLNGLEHILTKQHLDKIWEMIWRRWEYYEDFCNQR